MTRSSKAEQNRAIPSRARKRDASGTRAALLSAAARRFAVHGYDGTSVRDIAKDAGVDAALVYRYFGSKEALFQAASSSASIFEPLRHLPIEEVSEWVCQLISTGPVENEVPHPLLTMLRSSSRKDAVGRLHEEVTTVFSERFAKRLEGPDAELRAELLAAWVLGMTLMRRVVQSPALASAPDRTFRQYLQEAIDLLLTPPSPGDQAERE